MSPVVDSVSASGKVAGANGGTIGRASVGPVAPRERRGEGSTDYPGRVEAVEVERRRPSAASGSARADHSDTNAAPAGDHALGARNRGPD